MDRLGSLSVETAKMAIFRAASSRDAHSFPNAVFFFPVVERLAVDFMDRSFCDAQLAGLYGHEEINVIDSAVGTFHIDAREVFIPAETGEAIVVDLD